MKVKIINKSTNPNPVYSTIHSAGMDIYAFLSEDVVLQPGDVKLIPTGLFIELPEGYEAQIRPRSGLALKHGITLLNSPGTIDADYRGEIGIILINHSKLPFTVKNSDRICQMVIAQYARIEWDLTSELNDSERGTGGFGHTGVSS